MMKSNPIARFRLLAAALICTGLTSLFSCSKSDEKDPVITDEIELALRNMSLRQKVGQMFYGRPEMLDTTIHWFAGSDLIAISMQEVNDVMRNVNKDYPVGGIILYAHNIDDSTQLESFIGQLRQLNGSPLLCIDEEGGRVQRMGCSAKGPRAPA